MQIRSRLPVQALILAAGVAAASAANAQADFPILNAAMVDVAGNSIGAVTISVAPAGGLVRAEFSGIEPGPHSFNIHEVGICSAPPRERPEDPQPFQTAGGHLNVDQSRHGFLNPDGPHLGDMPNVIVPEGGAVTVEFFVTGLTVEMLMDSDGSSLVLRERADDYLSGSAGGRVGCGVITLQQ